MPAASTLHNPWKYWFISLVGCIICQLLLKYLAPVPNILPVELAPSPEVMQKEILANGENAFLLLKQNTLIDFIFIVAYSTLFLFSFKILFAKSGRRMPAWAGLLAIAPGVFDILENSTLLRSAAAKQALFSQEYYWVVRIKWALVALMVIVALLAVFSGFKKSA